jgi:acyl carrier protein
MIDTTPIRDFVRTRLLRPGSTEPGDEEPLFSNGRIDSFGVLELIAFLEERYGIVIDTAKHHIMDFDTLRRVEEIVVREREGSGRER